MTDITERLRKWDDDTPRTTPRKMPWPRDIMIEGAATIERLRANITVAIEALERNSTSAPVVEILRAALTAGQSETK
jgi:hypothetical protein